MAEVRVLMVGNRQVTMSVYNQLDYCDYQNLAPFGRVRSKATSRDRLEVVGRDPNGALARSAIMRWRISSTELGKPDIGPFYRDSDPPEMWHRLFMIQRDQLCSTKEWSHVQAMPLIVLAGLR